MQRARAALLRQGMRRTLTERASENILESERARMRVLQETVADAMLSLYLASVRRAVSRFTNG